VSYSNLTIPRTSQSGFSLVELIITIVLGGIVASMTTSILTQPIQAYMDSSRRATLTASADAALLRMQRDVRRALPNSIRISADGQTLELLHLIDGGRYRAKLASDGSGNLLDFSGDSSFEAFKPLALFSDQLSINNDRVVIYPLNSSGNNPYAGDNTAVITNIASATAQTSTISFSAFTFPLASPQQRFFIIDTAVTYHCDTSPTLAKDKVLMRYDGYGILSSQALPPSSGGGIQSNNIESCSFSYDSGSSTRSGLVTLQLVLTDDEGESVRLLHQVHVDNQP